MKPTQLSLAIAIGLVFATPALAQSAAQPTGQPDASKAASSESTDAKTLDQVMVTARRREEALLDVPLSISSFSGPQLEKLGAVDITDLNKLVPNVTLEATRGTNSTLSAFIRGVGQQDPVAGFEQGVGVYIDDVYLNRPHGAVVDIYDVERIEVLRGPQGTLYGRNTIGGAIKYVTKRLGYEPAAELSASLGKYSQRDFSGKFTLPVTDDFRIGATIASIQHDGYGKNIVTGKDNYDKDVLAGRVSMEWTPNDSIFVRIAGDWTEDDSNSRQGHRVLPSLLTNQPVLKNVYDTQAGLDTPKAMQRNRGISGTLEWYIDDIFTFKSISAFRKNNAAWANDFDGLQSVDIDVPVVYKDDQFSQELQLLFTTDRVSGVAGFYYLDANAFNDFDVVLGTTGALLNLPGLNANTIGDIGTKTWSLFSDVSINLTDTVELSLGGRYTEDKRSAFMLRRTMLGGLSDFFGGSAFPIATGTNFTGNATFRDFTPKAGISWKPIEDHMVYFSYSQGFKGGGFDPRGAGTAAPDLNGNGTRDPDEIKQFLQFDPEQVTAYEIGHKGSWLDGRVNTSLALFWNDYTDIQIPGSIGVDANNDGVAESFVGITTNAGKARIRGVEFEGVAELSKDLIGNGDSLSFTWSAGYIDAQFQKFINAFGVDIANTATFQNTPEWTGNVGFEYKVPARLFGMDGDISFLPRASYRSKTNQFETDSFLLDQGGYTLFDASLIWDSSDDHWSVSLHGRNLGNKRYITSGWDFVNDATLAPTLGLERTLTAFYGDPVTYYVNVKYRF